MAQIKYVVFACLIFLTGFISISAFQKISSSPIIKEPSTVIDNNVRRPALKESTDPNVAKGAQLFKQNCASCHALDKVLSGPALRGVTQRGPWAEDKMNLKKWVKNPAAFIPTSQYTRDLQKQYVQIMPSFSQLTGEDLEQLYQYLSDV
jgi:cytochrome c2